MNIEITKFEFTQLEHKKYVILFTVKYITFINRIKKFIYSLFTNKFLFTPGKFSTIKDCIYLLQDDYVSTKHDTIKFFIFYDRIYEYPSFNKLPYRLTRKIEDKLHQHALQEMYSLKNNKD